MKALERKARQEESTLKLYGGIDLHSNNSVVALIDEEEPLVYRKRLPNDAAVVLGALEPYARPRKFLPWN